MQPLNAEKPYTADKSDIFLQQASDINKVMLQSVIIDLFNKAFCEKVKYYVSQVERDMSRNY